MTKSPAETVPKAEPVDETTGLAVPELLDLHLNWAWGKRDDAKVGSLQMRSDAVLRNITARIDYEVKVKGRQGGGPMINIKDLLFAELKELLPAEYWETLPIEVRQNFEAPDDQTR